MDFYSSCCGECLAFVKETVAGFRRKPPEWSDITKKRLDICTFASSPYHIHKLAGTGNLREFQRLYHEDNSRLELQDVKGQTPTHLAAGKGRLNIITFIVEQCGDVNIPDKLGHTPLHVAVQKCQPQCIRYLLENGANPNISDNTQTPPLILAVELGCTQCLEALLDSPAVDPNITGASGGTGLHCAAYKDYEACAELLLRYGSKLCKTDEYGYYPMHIAAKEGSSKILQTFLEKGSVHGYSADTLLRQKDKDKNVPLHAAVIGGNMKVVEICLRHGAPIDAQQHDLSTPVHLACAQGNQEMVKVMFEDQPERRLSALKKNDAMGMTPLHTAALYDQSVIAEYLVQQGTELDNRDNNGRTPLLLAASKQGWSTVKLFISKGADMAIKDLQNRNFLHLATLHGAKLQDLGMDFCQKVKDFLNERDTFGCTPLHYASKEGHLTAIDDLISLGAFLNIKNNDKKSPLHFAARYGRLQTCIRLLESAQGSHIINETDNDGLTAMHLASENGHVKVVQTLIHKGAALHRDNNGNTALHMAAMNGYTQTMKLLLGVHTHILDATNKQGDTALHLAAATGHVNAVTLLMSMLAEFTVNNVGLHFIDFIIEQSHKECALSVIAHPRWQEVMELQSQAGSFPMIGLVQHLPDACLAVLDRCETTITTGSKGKHTAHHYNFHFLRNPPFQDEFKRNNGEELTPMLSLNTMVKYNRVECLSHPVCVYYLKMKWKAYGALVHMINIGLYIVFLAFLTAYVTTFDPMDHMDSDHSSNVTAQEAHFDMTSYHTIGFIVMTAFCILNVLKEIIQMLQQKLKYFMDWNNALEWVLYLTSALFILPLLTGHWNHMQWQCGAIAIFLAWFNLLLYLQRFDFFGIYVVMFLEILKTLVQVIIVFSILIIAFGLSFYILLSGEETNAHKTPGLSLLRTFVMMLGEIDFIPTFVDPYTDHLDHTMHFPTLSFIFLIIFVLLMPILLMNLLIGLAVGDIEAVQRNARLKRLAMQVDLHSDLERKLPKKFIDYVNKDEYVVTNNWQDNPCAWLLRLLFPNGRTGYTSPRDSFPLHSGVSDQHDRSGYLYSEVMKQRRRLKDMSCLMDKQYDLLKLIVQKMEIRTEADERDEGSLEDESRGSGAGSGPDGSGWTSAALQQHVTKSHIVSHWSKEIKRD